MKDVFIKAIRDCKVVKIVFYSKEDRTELTRRCAPMDYGPSRRALDKSDRFHFWDYDSDKNRHPLSLLPEQVKSIEEIAIDFSPAEFITWDTDKSPWFVKRDWKEFS